MVHSKGISFVSSQDTSFRGLHENYSLISEKPHPFIEICVTSEPEVDLSALCANKGRRLDNCSLLKNKQHCIISRVPFL